MKQKPFEIIIIGSGPAGLTAAVYTSRAFLNTLVIAGSEPGGQLMITSDVENFPGFSAGITGPELMKNMTDQVVRFGTKIINSNAISISKNDGIFIVKTNDGNEYKSNTVILATGASAKWLNLESEQRLVGKGVSACATCDGYFFKEKIVAVVGGGDSAMEEATFLTKFASKVYLLVRKNKQQMRAGKFMQKKAFENPKIEFLFNTEIVEVLGESKVDGLKIVNNVTEEEKTLNVDGLFLAIGHKPNTDFLKGFIELDENGYIKVDNNTFTSVEGIFAAGDVADYRYRQAVTAAGMGCMAALDAEKYLEKSGLTIKPPTTW